MLDPAQNLDWLKQVEQSGESPRYPEKYFSTMTFICWRWIQVLWQELVSVGAVSLVASTVVAVVPVVVVVSLIWKTQEKFSVHSRERNESNNHCIASGPNSRIQTF